MVLELLEAPADATCADGPLGAYRRFPFESEFSVSRTGTVRLRALDEGAGWRLVLERGVPRFIGAGGARLRALTDSIFEVTAGAASVRFRVVPEETPPLAWPTALDGLVTRVTPGDAGLDVLADVLLERRHPLGDRLRGLPTGFTDDLWQGDLPLLEADGVLDLRWSRGVVSSAIVRGTEGLDHFAAHLLTHLVQAVEVVLWEDASSEAAQALLERLSKPGLPWLSTLTVHGAGKARGALQRAWKSGWWKHRFPDGCALVTPAPEAVGLRHDTQVESIAPLRPVPLDEGTPPSFVRLRGATPVLTVNRERLLLNGLERRRPSPLRPWSIPLRVGDAFTLDAVEFQLVED